MVQPLWERLWRSLKKLNIELAYDPAILLLSRYPKESKAETQKILVRTMFLPALLTVAKRWG
jgi:hypothetical protein